MLELKKLLFHSDMRIQTCLDIFGSLNRLQILSILTINVLLKIVNSLISSKVFLRKSKINTYVSVITPSFTTEHSMYECIPLLDLTDRKLLKVNHHAF